MQYMQFYHIFSDYDFRRLKYYTQHAFSTRYDHSISVAIMSANIAKIFHCSQEKAFRAGLLHDFFFYDWHQIELPEKHVLYHPKEAAINAKKFDICEEEEMAIKSHMWPMGPLPKSRVGWCVTIADKICAVRELVQWRYKKYEMLKFIFT